MITSEETKKRNKKYFPIAKYLAKIIQTKKNIEFTQSQIYGWTPEICKLTETNGVAIARIKKAVKWYKLHIGEKFTPVIESGASLRSKFIKLEDAIQRENQSNPTQNQSCSQTPKEFFQDKFKDNSVKINACMFQYSAASNLIDYLSDEDKIDLCHQIIDLSKWYQKKQRFPNLDLLDLKDPYDHSTYCKWMEIIPNHTKVITQYIEWLEDQNWIDQITVNLFYPSHKIFQQFFNQYQNQVGFDFFTGIAKRGNR